MVTLTFELDIDATVKQPLTVHSVADAVVAQQLRGAMLQHASANAPLDVFAAAVLQDNRIDARALEQVRQHQAGRTGTDDRDLRANHQAG